MPVFPFAGKGAERVDAAGVINSPQFWAGGAGCEFWIANPNADLTAAAAATNPAGLDGWGWTVTSVAVVEGAAADFGSQADQGPTHFQHTASGDLIRSPRIFGGIEGFKAAEKFLYRMPTKLRFGIYASWPVNATNETTTFMGLGDGANATTTCGGAIVSDGAVWRLRSVAANDAGLAVDTAWHFFEIEWNVTALTIEWFIDGASQGSVSGIDNDIWPLPFKVLATNNDILWTWAFLRYS